jgi:hypothetical protein
MTEPVNTQSNDGLPDYRKTLNVPKPDVKNPDGLDTNSDSIPQRAGLPKREPQTLEFWNNQRVYEQSLQPTTGQGTFILHDGPPFSNGNIHIGHAFNKILKDVTVKYRSMQGYKAPYVPGWDNNGLPIEVLVAKEFRQKGLKPTRAEIRSRCREVAEQWYGVQKTQFERLGVRGDWSHPYLTMTREMASQELEVFAELVEKGFIYRGLRPVYWPTLRSNTPTAPTRPSMSASGFDQIRTVCSDRMPTRPGAVRSSGPRRPGPSPLTSPSPSARTLTTRSSPTRAVNF